MGLFDKLKSWAPKHSDNQDTKLIAPSDYENFWDAEKQNAPTTLVAPSDYKNYYAADKAASKMPSKKKHDLDTEAVAASDYKHIFAAERDDKGKETALFTDPSQSRMSKSSTKTSKSSRIPAQHNEGSAHRSASGRSASGASRHASGRAVSGTGNRNIDNKRREKDAKGQALAKRIGDHLNHMMDSKSKEIVVNKKNVNKYFRQHGITNIEV